MMDRTGLRAAVAAGVAALRRAARWWLGELTGLLPRTWRDREKPRIEARADEGGIKLCICGTGNRAEPGTLDGSKIEPAALATTIEQSRGSLPVWFLPATGTVLSRRLQVPRSVVSRFDNLLATEAERWTLFAMEELYLAWRPAGEDKSGKATIELFFIPRIALEQPLRALRSHGLEPSLIVLNEKEQIGVSLDGTSIKLYRRMRQLSIAAAVLAAAAFVLVDWLAATHQTDALRERIAFERRQFNRQRDVESKIASILATSADAAGQTATARNDFLVAVSGALPSTDWLTEVVIRGAEATLRGYTSQPEVLIKALEPLSKDRAVMLQGELSTDKRLNRSRFTVLLKLAR